MNAPEELDVEYREYLKGVVGGRAGGKDGDSRRVHVIGYRVPRWK